MFASKSSFKKKLYFRKPEKLKVLFFVNTRDILDFATDFSSRSSQKSKKLLAAGHKGLTVGSHAAKIRNEPPKKTAKIARSIICCFLFGP